MWRSSGSWASLAPHGLRRPLRNLSLAALLAALEVPRGCGSCRAVVVVRAMRAVAQRVSAASVEVAGEMVGSIGRGLLVYLGVAAGDGSGDVAYMVNKLAGLRIFEDDAGKMSRSVEDMAGGVLVVSQFTLFGDVRRGRRPSFDGAAPPERASELCDAVVEGLRARGLRVATGRFRAMMDVHSTVAGPVTILIDSTKAF